MSKHAQERLRLAQEAEQLRLIQQREFEAVQRLLEAANRVLTNIHDPCAIHALRQAVDAYCVSCDVALVDDMCPECGLDHSDQCHVCGQRGLHAVTCPEIG